MPSIVLLDRKTFIGGDELPPACLITILIRSFEIICLILPISYHLCEDIHNFGVSYFFYPASDSNSCRQSYLFPILLLVYAIISTLFSFFNILIEVKLWKACKIGTPTQPQLRRDDVAQLLELKLIPMSIVNFVIFWCGVVSAYHAKIFYICLKKIEAGSSLRKWDNSSVHNISTAENVVNVNNAYTKKVGPSLFRGDLWWVCFILLLILQALGIVFSILSLVGILRIPKGKNTKHLTLEEVAKTGDYEKMHHHTYYSSHDDMWENTCKFWCKCSGMATCFLFGGREIEGGDFGHVARVLTDYFEHGGTLDIVPSDIAAALVILQKIQREKKEKSVKSIKSKIDSSKSSLAMSDSISGISSSEQSLNLSPSNSINSFYSTVENDPKDPNVRLRPNLFTPYAHNVLLRDRRSDRDIIAEGARFARHALAIYTWMLYVFMNPISGLCTLGYLGCKNMDTKTSRKKLLSCCKSNCNDDEELAVNEGHPVKGSKTRSTKHNHRRLPTNEEVYQVFEGEIICSLHRNAMLRQAGLQDSDIVYAKFSNGLQQPPYCIILDHKWESVVVAIRGTLSLEDCIVDVLVDAEPLDELGREWGFDGENEYCHAGILMTAKWVMKDLLSHGKLEELLDGPNALYPTYTLRLVGHSLGAGCAVLLSLMLRQSYPTLKCLAYSPPGGFCTQRLANECKEFTNSFVLNNELVPRLSVANMEQLRNDTLTLIGRIRVPKMDVLRTIFRSSSPDLDDLLFSEDTDLSNTDYSDQLRSFERIQRDRKHHRGKIDVSFYPPGRIVHLVKMSEGTTTEGRGNVGAGCCRRGCVPAAEESEYTPVWADAEDFNEIVVSPSMGTDHFPNRMCLELENLARSFGVDVTLGSSVEYMADKWFDIEEGGVSGMSPV